MPKLIDKQESMKAICEGCFKSRAVDLELKCRGTCNVIDILQQQPAVEAEPVHQGRWIEDISRGSLSIYCSYCGSHKETICSSYYCPSCGARMDLRTPTEVALDIADSVMMGGADNG